MGRPFDMSKFRKNIAKSIDGLSVGFNDPKTWISTGCYALNYLISGDFFKGIPLGKVVTFAGESGCLPAESKVKIRGEDSSLPVEITVAELKERVANSNGNVIELYTPDGYQQIGEWFDKGQMPLVKVSTLTHSTICAERHLIQLANDEWRVASSLIAGDSVLTESGIQVITSIESLPAAECYDFEIKHANHRYWGDGFSSHNSGKSFFCSGNIIKNAQEQGIYVILIDTENALDEKWLHALGVDTSDDKLLKLSMSLIDDVAKTISEFVKEYKLIPVEDRPKVLFVVDSLGMLLVPQETVQFSEGRLVGSFGLKPKALMALVRNCVNMFGELEIGLVGTNHSYSSQSQYQPDDIISGGAGFIYASSIVVAMNKLKLKEDEDGNKIKDVTGIRASCKIVKTRYAKPFENIEVQIPYETGMSPYTGLFDLLEKKAYITKEGNRYSYIDLSGATHKYFRKEWNRNTNGIFDLVMKEFFEKSALVDKQSPVVIDNESDEITEE